MIIKKTFSKETIEQLARDNAIVANFLTAYSMERLSWEESLIGMVSFLVEHNDALLKLLREKKEAEIPLMVFHTKPANNEIIEKIQKLVQDDKVLFEPAYTLDSKGRMEIKHISINPRFKSCSEEE